MAESVGADGCTLLQSVGAAEAVCWQGLYWVVCHYLPSSSSGRKLEFAQSAGDSLFTLCEGHSGDV